jgi:hypothetical protein
LKGIDDDMVAAAIDQQPFADEQGRNGIAETNLDSVLRALAYDPFAQLCAFRWTDGDREERMNRAGRASDHRALANNTLDYLSNAFDIALTSVESGVGRLVHLASLGVALESARSREPAAGQTAC